jgi:hypothetical protein
MNININKPKITATNPRQILSRIEPADDIFQKVPQIIPEYKFGPVRDLPDLDKFPIYNQSSHSDCVAFGIKFITEYYLYKKTKLLYNISPFSLYHESRNNDKITTNDNSDGGTFVYTGIYAISNGVYAETSPFGELEILNQSHQSAVTQLLKIDSTWSDILTPPPNYLTLSKHYLNLTYGKNLFRIKRLINDIKYYLNFNLPIVFSLKIDADFYKIKSNVYKPKPIHPDSQGKIIMHCLVITGYDDTLSAFKCRNSYDTSWGVNGYFYMDYQMLTYYDIGIDDYHINDMYIIV